MNESIPRLLTSISLLMSHVLLYPYCKTIIFNIQILSFECQQNLLAFHSTASKYTSSLSVYSNLNIFSVQY